MVFEYVFEKIFQAFQHDLLALFLAVDHAHARDGGGDVRPVGQLAALLEGEVEQGRQHLRGQFDGDAIDPVEGLADRQALEDLHRALPDQRLEHRRRPRVLA